MAELPNISKTSVLSPVFSGFPGGSAGKESTCNVGDLSSIPGLGRAPGEGNSYPLQYSGPENSMDCIEFHGLIPPAQFFFLKISLAISGLLCLHTELNFFVLVL